MESILHRVYVVTLVIITFISIFFSVATATGNFTTIFLPMDVSIDLPNNWVVLSNNQRITLDTLVESKLDLSGIIQPISDLPFAANFYDDYGNTVGIINIRYYPNLELSQVDLKNLTANEIQEFDAIIKENVIKGSETIGTSLSYWKGTIRTELNGITVFITEYKRTSPLRPDNFVVRLVRVIADHRSFTLTVSYLDSSEMILRPITDRIISSLKLSAVE